ncbi:MAG: hypothetical protein AAF722_20445 [Cyanobacteria bacterium P01_C01_bin.70]
MMDKSPNPQRKIPLLIALAISVTSVLGAAAWWYSPPQVGCMYYDEAGQIVGARGRGCLRHSEVFGPQ